MGSEDLRVALGASLDGSPSPKPAAGDRLAAVLLPFVGEVEPSVVFTRRTDHLPRHAGEISFPGGLRHDEDPDLRATAVRETGEELGVVAEAVEVLGALSPVHTRVSGILVVPFVGMLVDHPVFAPNVDEIAEVLVYPVGRLARAEAEVVRSFDEETYRGTAYDIDGNMIWGVTARILGEFLALMRKEAPWVLGR